MSNLYNKKKHAHILFHLCIEKQREAFVIMMKKINRKKKYIAFNNVLSLDSPKSKTYS